MNGFYRKVLITYAFPKSVLRGPCIECVEWRRHSSLIFLILLFTKPNVEYQTKTHITHIVYKTFSRVTPPNYIALGPWCSWKTWRLKIWTCKIITQIFDHKYGIHFFNFFMGNIIVANGKHQFKIMKTHAILQFESAYLDLVSDLVWTWGFSLHDTRYWYDIYRIRKWKLSAFKS